MELFVPVVIGRSDCFGFDFQQSFENRSILFIVIMSFDYELLLSVSTFTMQ